jgi:hypothetical protein
MFFKLLQYRKTGVFRAVGVRNVLAKMYLKTSAALRTKANIPQGHSITFAAAARHSPRLQETSRNFMEQSL